MALTPEQNSPAAGQTTGAVTYHIPGEALRGAITTYYLVRVSGPGAVTDQIFPEWPNFRIIVSGKWTAKFPDVDEAPVPRAGVTGALERAVELLEHDVRHLFEAAHTRKPVTRRRRGVPANRRAARPPR